MTREEIIEEKLFETYKLSKFYLDLIANNKLENESPLLLADSFTQKLFEIVDRYDRLLEVNKQTDTFSILIGQNMKKQHEKVIKSNDTHDDFYTRKNFTVNNIRKQVKFCVQT